MTVQKYQRIKLIVVVALAIVFSQGIVLENYIIPLMALAAASLVLLALRRRVDGIMADERDYAAGGRAALLAIQVYAWAATAGMLVLYASRDLDPSYEPIAMTLAFSTCALMLLYALIFRYYDKAALTGKKGKYVAAALVFLAILAIGALRLFSGEDGWICRDGQWAKHGNPSFPAPAAECK
jgi:uncharacterized membrane protein